VSPGFAAVSAACIVGYAGLGTCSISGLDKTGLVITVKKAFTKIKHTKSAAIAFN